MKGVIFNIENITFMTVVFVYDIIPIRIRRFIDILVSEQIEGREEIANSNTHIWFHSCLSNGRVGRRYTPCPYQGS